nr:glycoside hydrolase family 38 C-terminal domain-containing protein [Candidatus Njordarchaeum guaymaensis]
MNAKPLRKIMIVSHTHWDREWYQSLQEYRLRLLKAIDKLLWILQRDPEYRHFVLDGQVIPLEDYLEIRPEKKDLLSRHIKTGRISIGPWYTQPDEWLSLPESLVRNLLFGESFAKDHDLNLMKVGYTPDSFGHTAQLPQILDGFDIDSFIFMRGVGDEGERLGLEFVWKAPNGSRVVSTHLQFTYSSGVFLGSFVGDSIYFYLNTYPATTEIWKSGCFPYTSFYQIYEEEPKVDVKNAIEHVKLLINTFAGKIRSSCLLVMNGADHVPPQESLGYIIRGLREHFRDLKIEHSEFGDYVKELRPIIDELPTYEGELRGARYMPVSPNVISTRIPQMKQPSFYAQTSLAHYLEPLSTLCWIAGDEYPYDLIHYVWRLVLQSLPHDSICGCGVDDVHKDVEVRLRQAHDIIRNLVLEKMRSLAKKVNTNKLGEADHYAVVFNPLNWQRDDTLEVYAEIPPANYVAFDESGRDVPILLESVDKYPHFREKQLVKLRLLVKGLPPLGYKTVKIKRVEEEQDKARCMPLDKIENEYFVVEVDRKNGGALRIVDKVNNATYENMNVLVDEGDAGDEYNFSPPHGQTVHSSEGLSAEVHVEKTKLHSCLNIGYTMNTPKGLDGQMRSDELVDLPVSIRVHLYPGIPRVDVSLNVENTAKDHRMRIRFKTGIKTEHSCASTHFYAIERNTKPPTGDDWVERPAQEYPMLYWVDATDIRRGIMFATHGLHEYQLNPDGTLYITLVRSVGHLSRDVILTRPGPAGPLFPTPDAQCIGNHVFNYSMIPHEKTWNESKAYKHALNFCVPPIAIVTDKHEGILAPTSSIVDIEPDSMLVTSVKRGEFDDSLIVRFYNQSAEQTQATLKPHLAKIFARKLSRAKLSEKVSEEISQHRGEDIRIDVRPWEIVTLKFSKE